MVKISRPKSLFGKHPYIVEQMIIYKFSTNVMNGASPILPEIATISKIPILLPSEEKRIKKSIKYFMKAKNNLKELGL